MRLRLKIGIVEGNAVKKVHKGYDNGCSEEMEIKDYHVLNEVVLDRGPSPFSIQVEIYIDDKYFTTSVGDG